MVDQQALGFLLASRGDDDDYGETSRIVTLLTRRHGVLSAREATTAGGLVVMYEGFERAQAQTRLSLRLPPDAVDAAGCRCNRARRPGAA